VIVLEAQGLHKRFGARTVVRAVDVAVGEGEVVGLLGPNGAGKTTVFRMLAGLLAPDAGTVRLAGQDVTDLPLHRRAQRGLGYLPQRPTVFRGLSVVANIELVLEARGRPRSLATELLDEAGLTHLADAAAERLSGGERRRLEMARCLAGEHRVLLLDEPFAGVDPVAVQDLQERVARLARGGLGILLTDHAVREAMQICQRVLILDGGELQCAGTPQEVAQHPRVRARYLGEDFRT
jgi:lipopolysaccharide export system ATP-binding protein